ncbi:MAG: DUF433 domain-containing protein [Planctomycetota bacterium]|nr:DUF433 domain-containing protein [Planctomycetota bacterium]
MVSPIGFGVYSIRDAAALSGLRQGRIREWFFGQYDQNHKPVFESRYREVTHEKVIGFLDLIDVVVAGRLRDQGLSLQSVRKVYHRLQSKFAVENPFCHKRLFLHGKTILLREIRDAGQEDFSDVVTQQRVFPEIVRPFLKELVYESETRIAVQWRIANGVVVDPQYCFGQPVTEGSRIPTWILAKSCETNGNDSDLVARWFNTTREEVDAAVAFESSLRQAV